MSKVEQVHTTTIPSGDIIYETISILHPVASYTEEKDAEYWAKECSDALYGKDKECTTFFVVRIEEDQEPSYLTLYKNFIEKERDDKDQAIMSLMDKGIIEQLIGEDGEFYYDLTDKGRKVADSYSVDLGKYFKKAE